MLKIVPFSDVLEERARTEGIKKGERTRIRLMRTTARLLQNVYFHSLRVGDICEGANVSQGTFYLYFKDKKDVSTALLSEFTRYVYEILDRAGSGHDDPRQSVYQTTLAYVAIFQQNRGLMRCLLQPAEELAEFEKIYRTLNSEWNRRVSRAIARWSNGTTDVTDEHLLTAYALGAMVDEFLTNLYVRRDPNITEIAGEPEQVAELLSRLWYRSIFQAPFAPA